MSKRDLFSEISSALTDEKQHDQGKLTLKTHKVNIPAELAISPTGMSLYNLFLTTIYKNLVRYNGIQKQPETGRKNISAI